MHLRFQMVYNWFFLITVISLQFHNMVLTHIRIRLQCVDIIMWFIVLQAAVFEHNYMPSDISIIVVELKKAFIVFSATSWCINWTYSMADIWNENIHVVTFNHLKWRQFNVVLLTSCLKSWIQNRGILFVVLFFF